MNYIIIKVKKEKPTDICIYGIDGITSDKEYQDGKNKNFFF